MTPRLDALLDAARARRVVVPPLVRAEFRKVVTLRHWWALAVAPVVVAVLSAASTRAVVAAFADSVAVPVDVDVIATGVVLGAANTVALIFAAVFGAVTAGSEFRHHTLTTTLVTARGRDGVLGAKLGVIAAFGAGYALIVDVVAIATMTLFGHGVGDAGDVFALCGAGILACVLWALLGAGVALLTGSGLAGSLSVVIWFVVGEWIVRALLLAVGASEAGNVLPASATMGALLNAAPSIDVTVFGSWPHAPLVLAAWAVLVCAAGWMRTRTRDIT